VTSRPPQLAAGRRLLIYCGDYKCAHSVVIDAGRWVTMCACPTLSRGSAVRYAVAAAPMSGRYLSRKHEDGLASSTPPIAKQVSSPERDEEQYATADAQQQ